MTLIAPFFFARLSSLLSTGLLVALAAMPCMAMENDDLAARPLLEAKRLDGSRYALRESQGGISLLVIWSPDSLASRKSLGELERFVAVNPPPAMTVLAVSTLDDATQLRAFARARQLTLPLAILEHTNLGPFPEAGMPYILVIDHHGAVRGAHRGLFRLQTLEALTANLR